MANTQISLFETAKHNMIEQQIRPWSIHETTVLNTLQTVNRHEFVPEPYQNLAYADCEIPLGNGFSMLKPVMVARLLQALNVQSTDVCLEVGTGSGYLTACFATLAKQVHSIDKDGNQQQIAKHRLEGHYNNLHLETGDMKDIVISSQRYDAISVAFPLPCIPDNLKQALKINGRLFVILEQKPLIYATLLTRTAQDVWDEKSLFEC